VASILTTERHEATLVLTLSDPATRNTLSEQLLSAGIEALDVAESDPEVRAVIVRGDGAHFCAGGNLGRIEEARRSPTPVPTAVLLQLHRFVEAVRSFPKPVIAAVEGAAAGAGFSIALSCDLIVAAADARFILSYAKLGLTPDGGATWHLARSVPPQTLHQWVWLAEPISAQQLAAFGVVNQVTDSGQAFAQALLLGERLASMAPNALASAKELVQQAPANRLGQHLDAEAEHFVANLFHDNTAEGIGAFFEKRAARFR
jgi:enoyl-CoA hydratase/carnithine racemase